MKRLLGCIGIGLSIGAGLGVPACARRDSADSNRGVVERGSLQIALETVSASGKVYRLRQAQFSVDDIFAGSSLVLDSEEDPAVPVLERFLAASLYQIGLFDGWFVEQVDPLLGTATFVDAILVSEPFQIFEIRENEETFVRFDFEVDGERVQFPAGRLIVGIGVQERDGGSPPGGGQRRDLLETSVPVVSAFSLEETLQAAQVNSGLEPDPVALYQQIIDSYASASQALLPGAVHCGDETTDGNPTLNGYPIRCDRLEHGQFENIGQWFATALVNRIDLAPQSGAHCGQQRMIFANNAPIGNGRMFIIVEAQIPNPRPECGVDACRPIAEFWNANGQIGDPNERAARLVQAFLTGSPELGSAGFGPFVSVANLSVGTGNVRTNNFNDFEWTLREFKLMADPLGQSRAIPFPVGESPHGALWNDATTLPAGEQCRDSFLLAVDGLLSDDPAEMAFVVDQACLDAESPNDFFTENYPFHLDSGSGAFRSLLEDRLMGTGLTPEDIALRAQFAGSCIGCHSEANGADLGRGAVAPFSNGFVHIDESFQQDCGDGTACFVPSPALTEVFLPRRGRSMSELLSRPGSCFGTPDGGVGGSDGGAPIPNGADAEPPDDAGAPPLHEPVAPPENAILTPDESLDELVQQEGDVRESLTGETLGGEPASATH